MSLTMPTSSLWWWRYSGSKNCSNICSFFNDCIGIACWHNPGFWNFCLWNYIILASHNFLDHVIQMRTHGIIGQTKLELIGAVFWSSIILLSNIGMTSICLDNCHYLPGHAFYKVLAYFWCNFIPLLHHSLPQLMNPLRWCVILLKLVF